MKFKAIIPAAVIGLLLFSGCNQSTTANKENSPEDKARNEKADSLMSCLGEMIGSQYYMVAQQDTNYNAEDSEKQFMLGFKQGLASVTERRVYNDGLMQGIQLAMHIREFNERYHVNVTAQQVVNSLNKALENKKGPDQEQMARLQVDYRRLMMELEKSINPEPAPAAVEAALPAEADSAAAPAPEQPAAE